MNKLILLSIIIFSSSSNSESTICPEVKSKGEGHWPLPENAFTKKAALNAISELHETYNKIEGNLFTSTTIGGLDTVPYVMNRLVLIRGFTLRSEAITDKHPKTQQWSINNFCKFIKEEAIVWH